MGYKTCSICGATATKHRWKIWQYNEEGDHDSEKEFLCEEHYNKLVNNNNNKSVLNEKTICPKIDETTARKEIERELKKYEESSIQRILKTNKFLKRIKFLKKGKEFELKKTIENEMKEKYISNTLAFHLVSWEAYEENLTTAFLVTYTAQSKFHRWRHSKKGIEDKGKNKNGNREMENNPNFIKDPKIKGREIEHIQKMLMQTHRDVYHNFGESINGKMTKYQIKFFGVTEKHRNLSPHMHIVYFIEPQHKNKFIEHITKINKTKNENARLDIQQLTGKNKKEETAGKEKRDIENIVGYTLKYGLKEIGNIVGSNKKNKEKKNKNKELIKTKAESIKKLNEINGWSKDNGIQLMFHSQTGIGKGNFKLIYKNISKQLKKALLKNKDLNNTNIMEELKKITAINTTIKKEDGEIIKKQNKVHESGAILKVEIEKERRKELKIKKEWKDKYIENYTKKQNKIYELELHILGEQQAKNNLERKLDKREIRNHIEKITKKLIEEKSDKLEWRYFYRILDYKISHRENTSQKFKKIAEKSEIKIKFVENNNRLPTFNKGEREKAYTLTIAIKSKPQIKIIEILKRLYYIKDKNKLLKILENVAPPILFGLNYIADKEFWTKIEIEAIEDFEDERDDICPF